MKAIVINKHEFDYLIKIREEKSYLMSCSEKKRELLDSLIDTIVQT